MTLEQIARQVYSLTSELHLLAAGGDSMTAPYTSLRSCARCAHSFATYQIENSHFFCDPCQAKRMQGFDPQPNSTVHLVDRWRTQFVVLTRVGDMLTLRRLGHPDAPTSDVHVANTMPTARDFR